MCRSNVLFGVSLVVRYGNLPSENCNKAKKKKLTDVAKYVWNRVWNSNASVPVLATWRLVDSSSGDRVIE